MNRDSQIQSQKQNSGKEVISEDSVYEANARDTFYNTLGTFFYFACQWLLTVMVVRLADFEQAGIFSIVLSVTNLFYCISMYGIRNFQITDVIHAYSDQDYLAARHITSLAAMLLFGISLFFLNLSAYTLACCSIYMLYKMEESYTDVYFGFFQKFGQYRQICYSYIAKGLFSLVTFCLTLWLTGSLFWTLLVNVIFMALIMAFYDGPYVKKDLKQSWTESLKQIFAYRKWSLFKVCFSLMLYSMLVPALNFIVRYGVEQAFGSEDLGYFSSITMVLSVLMVLMNSVFVTLIPHIALLWQQRDQKGILKWFGLAAAGFILLDILGIFMGNLLGDFIFSLVFGTEILPWMFLLPLTIHTSIVLAALTFVCSLLVSFRKNNWILPPNIACVLLCALLTPYLLQKTGMIGALWAMFGSLSLALTVLAILALYAVFRHCQSRTESLK